MSATADSTRDDAAHAGGWRPTPFVASSMGLHALAGVGLFVAPEAWPWLTGAVAADHAMLGAIGLWPRSTWLGPNLRRLPAPSAGRGEVAITFDDGPDTDVTPQVLDRLAEYGARASFFCIGQRAEAHAPLCAEIVARGHAIENHSGRHRPTFPMLGPGALRAEIARAQHILHAVAGSPPRFFRAPAGLRSPLLDPVLHRAGLQLVSWTRRGYDTRLPPAAVVQRLTRGLTAGDILLLHDRGSALAPSGRPGVLETLPRVLDAIARAGLRPVTLRDALAA
ncbi:MAG TPA: polysaccharide deacetylase family protein [Usitatibacter sp.]|jgi:peptidoglycan/xylan/chitin deacetylase (PgdA/CDA1 family)|nr:polysaccharide deacetylase family protein [Usitatibacter sp.]